MLNTIRCYAADLCQQYKGGHPGTVMGAAAIGVALWRYHLRYNPANPDWFARDRTSRFVLESSEDQSLIIDKQDSSFRQATLACCNT